jgi:large subunit ribosomal protein L14
MCIGIHGNRRSATIGSIISCSVKEVHPFSNINPGEVFRALVIRCRKEIGREDGRHIRFGDNAAVMLSKDFKPIGSRISGPVPRELRKTRYMKLISMAKVCV